jgi:biopolymer transport protein ExbD
MSIRFQCPRCESIRNIHDRMSGREIHCPDCDALVRIPIANSEASTSPTVQERDVRREQDIETHPNTPVDHDDDLIPQVAFAKKELPKDDMDMTPMVDVTFLLLIFFMITASFTTEKAIQQKASIEAASSQPPPDDENVPIKILIDEFNAYTVIFPDGGENEATSKQELISILKIAELDGSSEDASSIVIEAHEDSIHASVVGALDAGRQQNITNFKVTVVENFD